MAEENIKVRLDVDTIESVQSLEELNNITKESGESLGTLEKRAELLNKELAGVEIGTEEFKKLRNELRDTEAQLKDIDLAFEALDFEQRLTAGIDTLTGVAGGFAAVQGAMALAGAESEDFEKTMLKVQGAMALAMGVRDIGNAVAAMRKLNLATKAQVFLQETLKKLRELSVGQWTALIAVVGAVGAAIATLIGRTEDLTASQIALNEAREAGIDAMADEQAKILPLLKVARDENASKKARKEAIEQLNELAPEYLGNLSLETINTKEATAAIDAYIESARAKAEVTALETSLGDVMAERLKLERDLNKESSDQVRFLMKEKIKELKREENQILNNLGVLKEETLERKESTDEVKEANTALSDLAKTAAGEAKDAVDKIKESHKSAADEAKRQADETKRAREEQQKLFEQRKKEEASRTADIEAIDLDDSNKWREDQRQKDLEQTANYYASLGAMSVQHSNDMIERERMTAEERQAIRDTSIQATSDLLGALSSINSDLEEARVNQAGDNEERMQQIRKKAFERNKALQIASASISTLQGVVNILASKSEIPDPFSNIYKGFQIATLLATSAAQIAKIRSTSFQSGGGVSGVSAPTASATAGVPIAPTAGSTIIGGEQEPVQVYVTEADISQTQNNVQGIVTQATI